MKNKVCFLIPMLVLFFGLLAVDYYRITAATPPAPPSNAINPLLPPAGMIVITNTTLVYTNVACKTPSISFDNVTVYGGASAVTGATIVAWTASPDTNVVNYNVYYGKTSDSVTNKFTTMPTVTTVLFYGVMSTNSVYWAYATAVGPGGAESGPSNAVLVSGK